MLGAQPDKTGLLKFGAFSMNGENNLYHEQLIL